MSEAPGETAGEKVETDSTAEANVQEDLPILRPLSDCLLEMQMPKDTESTLSNMYIVEVPSFLHCKVTVTPVLHIIFWILVLDSGSWAVDQGKWMLDRAVSLCLLCGFSLCSEHDF